MPRRGARDQSIHDFCLSKVNCQAVIGLAIVHLEKHALPSYWVSRRFCQHCGNTLAFVNWYCRANIFGNLWVAASTRATWVYKFRWGILVATGPKHGSFNGFALKTLCVLCILHLLYIHSVSLKASYAIINQSFTNWTHVPKLIKNNGIHTVCILQYCTFPDSY